MLKVNNLLEAEEWFKNNTMGILCMKKNRTFYANSCAEAENFFLNIVDSKIILAKIVRLEEEIKKQEEWCNYITENLTEEQVEPLLKTKNLTYKQYKKQYKEKNNLAIQETQNKIDKILKDNPQVESLYICIK